MNLPNPIDTVIKELRERFGWEDLDDDVDDADDAGDDAGEMSWEDLANNEGDRLYDQWKEDGA